MLRVDKNEIYIYDVIGPEWFGLISANMVIDALNQVGNQRAIVHFNSPGGGVDEGVAAYNAMKRHREKYGLTVVVDSLAASIASVMAMAGDKITMAEGSMLMIHEPWTVAVGDSRVMKKTAEILDKTSESLIGIYAGRTKKDEPEIKSMLAEETWMTAKDAVSLGFADDIEGIAVEPVTVPDGMFAKVPDGVHLKPVAARKRDQAKLLAKLTQLRGRSI
jgi:ATP-dependent Clp protease protease subunit